MKKSIDSVISCSTVSQSVVQIESNAGLAEFSGILPNTIRIRLTVAPKFEADRSYSIEKNLPEFPINLIDKDDELLIKAREITIGVNKEHFALSIYNVNNALLSRGKAIQFDENSITDVRTLSQNEDFFGMGERVTPFGRRGYRIINWNRDKFAHHNETDPNLYSSFPLFVSANPESGLFYGYFLDSSYRSEFDMGAADWNEAQITVFSGELNLYLFTGSLPEIISAYTELTGRIAMPPIWTIAYHQCRWSYMSTDEGREIANEFRKRDIPCDVLWYDIDFMDGYRVFTFDSERFGDAKEAFAETKKEGFRTVLIVDPGVKADDPKGVYDVNDEGTLNRYFLRNPDGTDYIGKVWPGLSKFPDFSRPEVRKWWGELHKRYYEKGADAFWNDMNEIADFTNEKTSTVPPETIMWDNGRWSAQDRMHNVYGLLEAKATFDGMLSQRPNERPFLLTRAAFSGIQKYAAKWCGDNTSTWNHLKASIQQIINMGLSGIGFVGVDVGGFGSTNCNPELLIRWTQLGAFYPFFRNHAAKGTIYQEPWRFGEEAEKICREAIKLRYHLLPYFYQLFRAMHLYGYPVFRPLFWNYSNEKKTFAICDQFMVGDSLMVAPVVERGETSRKVYFPEGKWFHYFTGKEYAGKSETVVSAPLDSIPLFIKEGAAIPAMKAVASTAFMDNTHLIIKCVPSNNKSISVYYEDDGLSNNYIDGKFSESTIELTAEALYFKQGVNSLVKTVTVEIPNNLSNSKGKTGFEPVSGTVWKSKTVTVEKETIVPF